MSNTFFQGRRNIFQGTSTLLRPLVVGLAGDGRICSIISSVAMQLVLFNSNNVKA